MQHGPGRQSESLCELPGGHADEHRIVVEVWEWSTTRAYVDDFGQLLEKEDIES